MKPPLYLSQYVNREYNNLDLMRSVCAICVIYGHIPAFMVSAENYDIIQKLFPCTYAGRVGVECFFFISGLLVTNSLVSNGNWKIYLLSRFFRIWPGLLVCTTTTVICCAFIVQDFDISYLKNGFRYIGHWMVMKADFTIPGVSFMTHPSQEHADSINGSLWTLPLEVRAYGLLLAFFWISNLVQNGNTSIKGNPENTPANHHEPSIASIAGRSRDVPKNILACFFIILMLSIWIGYNNNPVAKSHFCMFFLAALLSLYKEHIPITWKIPFVLFVIYYALEKNASASCFFLHLSIVMFVCWLASLKHVRKIKIKHDISYGIYIYGFPVQQFILYAFPDINYWAYFVSCVFVSCIFAYLSCVYVEEPALRFAGKIKQKLQNPPLPA